MIRLTSQFDGTRHLCHAKYFRYSALMIGLCTGLIAMNSHADVTVDSNSAGHNSGMGTDDKIDSDTFEDSITTNSVSDSHTNVSNTMTDNTNPNPNQPLDTGGSVEVNDADAKVDYDKALQDTTVSPVQIALDTQSFDSPEHIEQLLADFNESNSREFSAPVSRLDNNSAPLGLDKILDDNTNQVSTIVTKDNALYESVARQIEDDTNQDSLATNSSDGDDRVSTLAQPALIGAQSSNIQTPSAQTASIQTSGIETPSTLASSAEPAISHPNAIASKTASMGNVPINEDITNSTHPNFIADTDNGYNSNALNDNADNDNADNDDADNKITAARINEAKGRGAPLVAEAQTNDIKQADMTLDADIDNNTALTANETPTINADSIINPDEYLPQYEALDTEDAQAQALDNTLEASKEAEQDLEVKEGLFKRLYNRLFNDGVSGLPRIDATVYIQDDSQVTQDGKPMLIEVDDDTQPMNNIRAAIENITVEAIKDFPAAAPRLNEEALSAARAVGYYDIDLHFEQVSGSEVNIIIERLGEPVLVQNRVVDIRGEGEDLTAFNDVENNAIPLTDDVLNHEAYENTKIAIDSISNSYGFFDGEWLNTSVDVILPDDTADIDVIYQTGERYVFGDVVFFTFDKELKQLTQDADKLPVNLELLQQLYAFEPGEPYYNPLVTEFTNDLSATQYFNMVNVDVIRPSDADATLRVVNEPINNEPIANEPINNDQVDEQVGDGVVDNQQTIASNDAANDAANNATNDAINDAINNTVDAVAHEDGLYASTDNQTTDTSMSANADSLQDDNLQDDNVQAVNSQELDDDIEPIKFDVDEQTADKLRAIKAKARRLSVLPDDRVLDATDQEAKNLLGKISNAISNVVKKILPDESEPLVNVDENFKAPVLAGKITPQEVLKTKRVPIYVFVMADKPRDAQIGFGYGSDTGFRAVGQLQHNLLTKDGYQAGIRVGASDVRKSVNLELNRPWKHPLDDTLHANLAYEQEVINQGEGNLDLKTDTLKAGIARNRRPPSGWDRTYSLRYRLDELESGVRGANREDLPEPFNRRDAKFTQQSLLLGYAMHKVQSDNLTDPTHGFGQYYSLEVGSDSLLTDTNMAILRARLGTVQSFGEFDKHQIVANLDTGYIWADDFDDVPYKQRFFAGGDRSLRGYDYNSLSALDNGYLVGGQVLALGSMEYNYEFKPNFRGAVFADVGNAYDTDFTTETKLGLGGGIRWSSPIGLVRLDVAAGVLEESVPIRLHFFIGSPLQ